MRLQMCLNSVINVLCLWQKKKKKSNEENAEKRKSGQRRQFIVTHVVLHNFFFFSSRNEFQSIYLSGFSISKMRTKLQIQITFKFDLFLLDKKEEKWFSAFEIFIFSRNKNPLKTHQCCR